MQLSGTKNQVAEIASRLDCFLSRKQGANFASGILFDLDLVQDDALSRAHARQVGCGGTYRHASVGNGVMKLLQHKANG